MREIGPDMPFSILVATQVSNAARLLCRMDSGHGLVDRFQIAIPPAFRSFTEELADCQRLLQKSSLHSMNNIYEHVLSQHSDDITYYFEDDAQESLQFEHIQLINEALTNGKCTPQTKKCDIIPRLAVGLHVFEFITLALLGGNDVPPIPQLP